MTINGTLFAVITLMSYSGAVIPFWLYRAYPHYSRKFGSLTWHHFGFGRIFPMVRAEGERNGFLLYYGALLP